MSSSAQMALTALACLAAFVAAFSGAGKVLEGRASVSQRAARMRAAQGLLPLHDAGSLERAVLSLAARLEGAPQLPRMVARIASALRSNRSWEGLLARAGLGERLVPACLRGAQARLAGGCAAAGAVLGFALSTELGLVLALIGAAAGFAAPAWALGRVAARRSAALEHSLPEMLEVVALGLRSGLSFDRSLQLYSEHFPSSFSQACASAQKSWSLGLRTREEALRELAASYGSDQLERTVERVVRSLRFGSALAPDLEAAAVEARARRRAQVEERVAKAPVKMMVPTGALILPAMLILVLGPVLLELMQG